MFTKNCEFQNSLSANNASRKYKFANHVSREKWFSYNMANF